MKVCTYPGGCPCLAEDRPEEESEGCRMKLLFCRDCYALVRGVMGKDAPRVRWDQ